MMMFSLVIFLLVVAAALVVGGNSPPNDTQINSANEAFVGLDGLTLTLVPPTGGEIVLQNFTELSNLKQALSSSVSELSSVQSALNTTTAGLSAAQARVSALESLVYSLIPTTTTTTTTTTTISTTTTTTTTTSTTTTTTTSLLAPGFRVAAIAGCDARFLSFYTSVDLFDTGTMAWAGLKIGTTPTNHGAGAAAGWCQGTNSIILAGGTVLSSYSSIVESYDLTNQHWTTLPKMSLVRAFGAGVCLPDMTSFLVAGGTMNSNSAGILSTVEIYDIVSGTWLKVGGLNVPRRDHAMVLYNDQPTVIGGRLVTMNQTVLCESYDVAANQWNSFPSLNLPRFNLAAAVVAGKIYAFGGYINQIDDLEVFDNGKWLPMQSPMKIGTLEGFAAVPIQEKIMIFGGTSSSVMAYEPATQSWASLKYMSTPVRYYVAAAVFN